MTQPPYCLKLATFALGCALALLGMALILIGHMVGAVIAFAGAGTAVLCIPRAGRMVERRERADILARYRTRPPAVRTPVAGLVLRVTGSVVALAAVMAWALQTPNGDAAVARSSCAGSLVAGSKTC